MTDGWLEAGGARLRYLEAGEGTPLVHLQDAGAVRLTPAQTLLSRRFRLIVLETPEPALSPSTIVRATERLGLDTFNLVGSASASLTALGVALHAPERVLALVLEAPAAIGPEAGLAALATPTLALCGTRDADVTAALARRCAALMPNGHVVFVYDAGPAIGVDRPEAFAEVVGDFLERHEAFVIRRTATVIHP